VGGIVFCDFCQTRYVPSAQDAPAVESHIGVGADVQALLEKCRDDPANSRRYASLVLDIDPSNVQAQQVLARTQKMKKKWWQ